MRLKVERLKSAIHPSEVVVSVETVNGDEHLVVHQRSIQDGTLEIGFPISSRDSQHLVELPRETVSGAWRIWVPSDSVL